MTIFTIAWPFLLPLQLKFPTNRNQSLRPIAAAVDTYMKDKSWEGKQLLRVPCENGQFAQQTQLGAWPSWFDLFEHAPYYIYRHDVRSTVAHVYAWHWTCTYTWLVGTWKAQTMLYYMLRKGGSSLPTLKDIILQVPQPTRSVKNCSASPFSTSPSTSLAKHGQLNEPCSRKKKGGVEGQL